MLDLVDFPNPPNNTFPPKCGVFAFSHIAGVKIDAFNQLENVSESTKKIRFLLIRDNCYTMFIYTRDGVIGIEKYLIHS